MKHPIENIIWLSVDECNPNDYNPNTVLDEEMKLLAFSIMKQGWIQPILVSAVKEDGKHPIIDGFHRWWLTSNHDGLRALTNGKVPAAMLEIGRAERIALTVRINRAKGVHAAMSMHELVTELFNDHEWSKKQISEEIGATMSEVDLLLQEGVFTKKKTNLHKYSPAWESNLSAGGYIEPLITKLGGDEGKLSEKEIKAKTVKK